MTELQSKHPDLLVSVIVPAYNTEDYVEECIRSILTQTHSKLEVILVDDGSSDDTGSICDRIAREDERLHVFHQANVGLSASRNFGLSVSAGEYILFVDSDDVVSPVYVAALLDSLLESGKSMSVVRGGSVFWDGRTPELASSAEVFPVIQMSSHEYLEQLLYQRAEHAAYYRMFEKGFLDDKPFPEDMIFEDMATTYGFVARAEGGVAFIDSTSLYAVRVRTESITSGRYSHFMGSSAVEACRCLIEDIEESYPDLLVAASSRCFSLLRFMIPRVPASMPEDLRMIWSELVRFRRDVLFDPKARKRERLFALISYFGRGALRAACMLARGMRLMR